LSNERITLLNQNVQGFVEGLNTNIKEVKESIVESNEKIDQVGVDSSGRDVDLQTSLNAWKTQTSSRLTTLDKTQ
jgi:hypothetical protein